MKGVWEVLAAAHKYGLDPKSSAAKMWFLKWYLANSTNANWKRQGVNKRFDFKDYQSLLFPCHTFDYAQGFKAATQYLVYHAKGHITERRPDGFLHDHLRLDQIIIRKFDSSLSFLKIQ